MNFRIVSFRRATLALIAGLCIVGAAKAQPADPEQSEIWKKVRSSLFAATPIAAQARDIIKLETPPRAEDAAIMPVAIRAQFDQTKDRFIERVWLIVDKNPSPISAEFAFTQDSGRADIETRIRVEEYSFVRAIARTNDGKLHMVANFVKASGGCSAPAGKDAEIAKANMGKMRLTLEGVVQKGRPTVAQLMISHPNDSGLAMDQLTRTYAPPHFVRRVEVKYAGKLVFSGDVDFSISENPNFRFNFAPQAKGDLEAYVVDNLDKHWTVKTPIDVSTVAKN